MQTCEWVTGSVHSVGFSKIYQSAGTCDLRQSETLFSKGGDIRRIYYYNFNEIQIHLYLAFSISTVLYTCICLVIYFKLANRSIFYYLYIFRLIIHVYSGLQEESPISPNKDHDYQFIASADRVFTAQETDKHDYRMYDVILRRKHAQHISFNFLCVTVLLKLCKNRWFIDNTERVS